MASPSRRLKTNAPGEFFVDSSCIDCGTCRWVAQETFDAAGGYARVYHQPDTGEQEEAALRALVACPVAAIGTTRKRNLRPTVRSFPNEIADGVYHCGFHSPDSFGATSYLIVRPRGNILVDSPRFTAPLVHRIEALGGVQKMFFTHRDDVADHDKFAAHFGCQRILHERDLSRSTKDVELVLRGDTPEKHGELLFLPTPGHTAGSVCLIYRDKFLFSGDHVAFSIPRQRVYAFRGACWHSWTEQIQSMKRLAEYRFEYILPGHGAPGHFPSERMKQQIEACIAWMRSGRWAA